MAWLRLYDDILDDPKVQMLPAIAFRMLINLWCIAKRNGGTIPANLDTLSFSLRMPVVEVGETLQLLVTTGLIDKAETGYAPHNWQGRQFESDTDGAERMRRYRARNKPSPVTSPVTSPLRNAKRHTLRNSDVLDTDTDTDIERRNTKGSVGSSFQSEPTGDKSPLTGNSSGIQPGATKPPAPPNPPPEVPKAAKPDDPWAEIYARGKQVLGQNAGGLITNLKLFYDGKPRKVLAKLEDAAEQREPREWLVSFLLKADDGGRLSGQHIG